MVTMPLTGRMGPESIMMSKKMFVTDTMLTVEGLRHGDIMLKQTFRYPSQFLEEKTFPFSRLMQTTIVLSLLYIV